MPGEILVVDSSSEDATQDIVASYAGRGVSLDVIERTEFNHGATRHRAFMRTVGDYTLFMTQDAVPAGDRYIERLTAPLEADKAIALVSGRQLPKPDARRFEQLVREFNYPDEPSVRGAEDLLSYGIKTFFASDVCSAYRRKATWSAAGSPRSTPTRTCSWRRVLSPPATRLRMSLCRRLPLPQPHS